MTATADLAPPQVRWDLSDLFSSMEDPKIEQTWSRCMQRSQEF